MLKCSHVLCKVRDLSHVKERIVLRKRRLWLPKRLLAYLATALALLFMAVAALNPEMEEGDASERGGAYSPTAYSTQAFDPEAYDFGSDPEGDSETLRKTAAGKRP